KKAVRPSLKALVMATGSGALIGTFMILIDLTPDDSGLVPLIANRSVNAAIMVSVIAVLAVIAARRVERVELVETSVKRVELVETSRARRGFTAALKLAIFCGVL